jgi:hypothetical protein
VVPRRTTSARTGVLDRAADRHSDSSVVGSAPPFHRDSRVTNLFAVPAARIG